MTVFFLLACNSPVASSRWEVHANLYSGRENPQRQLSSEEAEQFEAMLAELPVGTVSQRGELGYQGFMVQREGQTNASGIIRVIVYDGIVEVTEAGGSYYLGDPDRALEQWLFDVSRGILADAEQQLIEEDLNVN